MAEKLDSGGTLIIGCGYVGLRVAQRLRGEFPDQAIYTTTRSQPRADWLAGQGFVPVLADWTDRRTLGSLPRCKRVLVAVAYDRRSRVSRQDSQVGGLSNLLDVLPGDAELCYLSTTGVYHQRDGRWVDENSPARPVGAGGQVHLQAESLLHRRRPAGRWTVLRLAGIYGPGRVPHIAEVIAGRPLQGPHAGYLNLIHREDVAEAILAVWRHPSPPRRLYLVADDQPVIRRSFYEQISRLAGSPPPEFATTANPSLSSRSASNKRVWNRRMRRDLLPRLHYANYIQGLTDLLG